MSIHNYFTYMYTYNHTPKEVNTLDDYDPPKGQSSEACPHHHLRTPFIVFLILQSRKVHKLENLEIQPQAWALHLGYCGFHMRPFLG